MELNNETYERYRRQIALPLFGEAAQLKLINAKVLVVGAGGLGCPVLQYLTAAGIGTLGIVDGDMVALSNLHRQLLYLTEDIGLSKALCARRALEHLNPNISFNTYSFNLTTVNALTIIQHYDIVVDGTDNFSSRYLINDACILLNKPLIHGSIYQFEGQLALFNYTDAEGKTSANYRDLFPIPPAQQEVSSCNLAGVIGVLPGIIGTMMANECIKVITGIGTPLLNRLLIYNSLNNTIHQLEIIASLKTLESIPLNIEAFQEKDYALSSPDKKLYEEINMEEFKRLMRMDDTIVIDVREKDEKPAVTTFNHINLPMSKLGKEIPIITQKNILLFCHSGIRSKKAALLLSNRQNKVYHLKGGIIKWMDFRS
jgi:molybdopterin/thiamine biosynthesis adenylyltransferase/rhodanese-related sulfurtransferase